MGRIVEAGDGESRARGAPEEKAARGKQHAKDLISGRPRLRSGVAWVRKLGFAHLAGSGLALCGRPEEPDILLTVQSTFRASPMCGIGG